MTTTKKDLDCQEQALNNMLSNRNSNARVLVQGRNGYTALDLMNTDNSTLKTLCAGTKREIELYLLGMKEAFWLLEEPFVHHA